MDKQPKTKEDYLVMIQHYLDKAERCKKSSLLAKDNTSYRFWDGFSDCAASILREFKD